MAYVPYNPNPSNQRVGDCVVRALSKVLGKEWEDTYIGLAAEGLFYHDMPSSDYVWGMYLRSYGFEQKAIPSVCPQCTTVKTFSEDHRKGRYVVKTQNHVVAVIDGDYYDSFDSGNEVVLYFWEVNNGL